MPFCKKCNAKIDWIVTSAGRKMPIDAFPAKNKKRVAVETASGPVDVVPHFATCPFAGEFKRKEGPIS